VSILKEKPVIPTIEELATRPGGLTPSVVFWAGMVVSVSLCAAIRLPVVLAFIVGVAHSRKYALALSVFFTLGLIVGVVLLGTATVPADDGTHRALQVDKHLFWGLGAGLFVAGVLVSGLINPQLLPGGLRHVAKVLGKTSLLAALFSGLVLGWLQTPACPRCCDTLLSLAQTAGAGGSSPSGLVLLVSFAAGQSLLVLAVSILVSLLRPDLLTWLREQMCSVEPRIQLVAGNMLMVLGIYFVIVG
jgi:cytochrome c biogenesis protein CcdA